MVVAATSNMFLGAKLLGYRCSTADGDHIVGVVRSAVAAAAKSMLLFESVGRRLQAP